MSDPKTAQRPDRTPIPIERLLITHTNPNGVELPSGPDGKSVKRVHTLVAGTEADVRTEIEHQPWARVFRVTRSKKVTRSGEKKGDKEIVTFEPMGKPFRIPDTWAVSVAVED